MPAQTTTAREHGARLARNFRTQSRWCADAGADLYAVLLSGMATDLERGGITAQLCQPYLDAPETAAIHIRLLAGLHEIVLAGHAPELEAYYPSVGGTWPPDGVWAVASGVMTEHADRLRAWLKVVPQTNEVGRSVALAVGLATSAALTGRRRIRLLQLGASAGLHLLVDDFRIEADTWAWGSPDSPVRIADAARGRLLLTPSSAAAGDLASLIEIVDRRGCDLFPVDVTSPAGRRRLQAFIWPHDRERHERLAAAMELAEAKTPVVDAADAPDWLESRLSEPCDDDVLTVVWSSITLQYLDQARQARIAALIARGRDQQPLVQVALESTGLHYVTEPRLTLNGRFLGSCPPHGVPLLLER